MIDAKHFAKIGIAPETYTAMSIKNKFLVMPYGSSSAIQLGVTSSINTTNSRAVQDVKGVGYGDMIAEIVPSMSEVPTLSINRTMLYRLNAFQSFGYAAGMDDLVRALAHHKYPFDLRSELVISGIASGTNATDYLIIGSSSTGSTSSKTTQGLTGVTSGDAESRRGDLSSKASNAATSVYIVVYDTCWITSRGLNIGTDTTALAEDLEVSCTEIHSGNTQSSDMQDYGDDGFSLAPEFSQSTGYTNVGSGSTAGYL